MVLSSAPTFRTEVPIEPRTHRLIRHDESLLALGSCFSDGVGQRLCAAGHDALSNPLGTLFNPASIRRAVELFSAPDLASPSQDGGGLWFNFDAGTALSRPTSADCDDAVARALAAGLEALAALRAARADDRKLREALENAGAETALGDAAADYGEWIRGA